jgi:hypothetical protein
VNGRRKRHLLSLGLSAGRFTLLLWSLPLFLILSQFIGDLPGWRTFFDLLLALVLIDSVKATGLSWKGQLVAWSLLCVAIPTRLAGHAFHDHRLEALGAISVTGVMALVTVAFVLYAIRAGRVDTDVVSAALCAYLLMGATFGVLYSVIESISPGSFIANVAPPSASGAVNSSVLPTLHRADFVYFSLVAMTTVGFGDIVAVSRIARALTVVEIVIGQLYLVVMIARLVSLWHQPDQSR